MPSNVMAQSVVSNLRLRLTGSGNIVDSVDLEPGGWVDYVLICGIASTSGTVINVATVTEPPGVIDPEALNSSSTDSFPVGVGRVPDGKELAGSDVLRVGRTGSDLVLTWGPSCVASDLDYEVYEGSLGNFDSHVPVACTTGALRTSAFEPAATDTYYLVVPTNQAFEGSHGRDSAGFERSAGAAACRPQAIAACS